MATQDVYVNVVLPFMEAARKGGLSAAQIAGLVGVSRSTPYLWQKKKFVPDEQMQDKLLQLTRRIISATDDGILPMVIDVDTELRKRLGWPDDEVV